MLAFSDGENGDEEERLEKRAKTKVSEPKKIILLIKDNFATEITTLSSGNGLAIALKRIIRDPSTQVNLKCNLLSLNLSLSPINESILLCNLLLIYEHLRKGKILQHPVECRTIAQHLVD